MRSIVVKPLYTEILGLVNGRTVHRSPRACDSRANDRGDAQSQIDTGALSALFALLLRGRLM